MSLPELRKNLGSGSEASSFDLISIIDYISLLENRIRSLEEQISQISQISLASNTCSASTSNVTLSPAASSGTNGPKNKKSS